AQLAAESLGVPFDRVNVELGDTLLPAGPYSGGSQATASFTPAVEDAARKLRRQLIEMTVTDPGSPLHGLAADLIVVDDGYLRSKVGNRSESLADLLARLAPGGLDASASADPDEAPPYSS